jgi:hypothetical protein
VEALARYRQRKSKVIVDTIDAVEGGVNLDDDDDDTRSVNGGDDGAVQNDIFVDRVDDNGEELITSHEQAVRSMFVHTGHTGGYRNAVLCFSLFLFFMWFLRLK